MHLLELLVRSVVPINIRLVVLAMMQLHDLCTDNGLQSAASEVMPVMLMPCHVNDQYQQFPPWIVVPLFRHLDSLELSVEHCRKLCEVLAHFLTGALGDDVSKQASRDIAC